MRQIIKINVDLDAVMEEVDKTLSYIASKEEEAGKSYEHIRLNKASREMTDRFREEAKEILMDMFADYGVQYKIENQPTETGGANDNQPTVTAGTNNNQPTETAGTKRKEYFELGMPSNYDERRNAVIEYQVFLLLVYHMVDRWLNIVGSDRQAEYAEKVVGASVSINENLHKRVRPRRTALPTNDYENEIDIHIEVEEEEGSEVDAGSNTASTNGTGDQTTETAGTDDGTDGNASGTVVEINAEG